MKGGYNRKVPFIGQGLLISLIVLFTMSLEYALMIFMEHVPLSVTFMELNLIMWTSYLVYCFVMMKTFIGEHSPVTALVAFP